MMTMRSPLKIADISEGRVRSFVAVITELDEQSITVAVGTEGRLVPIFHMVFSDPSASVQCTAWDRSSELPRLRVGQFVHVENVVARAVRTQTYADYGPLTINFSRHSKISEVVASNASEFPTTSIRRVPSITQGSTQGSTRASPSPYPLSNPQTPTKRAKSECCPDPTEPFCTSTGLPHEVRCQTCGEYLTARLYCAKTGQPH